MRLCFGFSPPPGCVCVFVEEALFRWGGGGGGGGVKSIQTIVLMCWIITLFRLRDDRLKGTLLCVYIYTGCLIQ